MKSVMVLCSAALVLSACNTTPTPSDAAPLPFFGDGYRAEGDQCRRIGEDEFTNQFMDDSADLVGCPTDYEGLGPFVVETGAVAIHVTQGFTLYSVPRG